MLVNMTIEHSYAAHSCHPCSKAPVWVSVLARRELRKTVRLYGGQMGEAVKKQRGKALFFYLSLTVCQQNASGRLLLQAYKY